MNCQKNIQSRGFLLAIAVAVLLPTAALRAATVPYPSQDPAFTIAFPEGWLQQVSPKGNLVAQPPGRSGIRLTVFALPASIANDDGARRALDGFARSNASAFGITGLAQNHPVQPLKVNDALTMLTADYAGKLPDGGAAAYSLGFFTPGRGRYFGLVIVGSDAADKASAADQASILHSLSILPPAR